ncbi:acetoin utilization protein [Kiloniella spongiae]|uniref:Acetoin utilization protein n=1 Tax=Kiloniella spongiae TaxID=1489064 RepID=A0A0H2MIF6_9PROT|nr:histone deacetylase family protein [Kiloniella spongiae]KLN60522.1 acetoin utilization protein [Kiloniella spongiae]
MTTALFTHPVSLLHDTGIHHPESPRRIEEVLKILSDADFDGLDRREAPVIDNAKLLWAHTEEHVASVFESIPDTGYVAIDGDTVICKDSGEAALRAAGGICAAVDAVITGEVNNAFCLSRPPGHHAERDRAMGFCLFCNPAIGAYQARNVHGFKKIVVIDFDVHHGNGTQDVFWNDPDMFYASTHESPLFPGTGSEGEAGVAGNIMNCPLPSGAGSYEFRKTMEDKIFPAVQNFEPELIIVSAGFDAHREDPLASINLEDEDFGWVSKRIVELSQDLCDGRLVSVLEGGYNTDALARSVALHIRALMNAAE